MEEQAREEQGGFLMETLVFLSVCICVVCFVCVCVFRMRVCVAEGLPQGPDHPLSVRSPLFLFVFSAFVSMLQHRSPNINSEYQHQKRNAMMAANKNQHVQE